MKRALHFLLTFGVLAAFAYVLSIGLRKPNLPSDEAAPARETAAVAAAAAPDDYSVTLDSDQIEKLALEVAPLEALEHAIRVPAYGSVVDPAPLFALADALALAETALVASQSDYERTRALAATSDASRKSEELARAQFRSDQIRLAGAQRSLLMQGGAAFSRDRAEDYAAGRVALVRVELLPGDAISDLPESASLRVVGHEEIALNASEVLSAPLSDPLTQGQGFLLRVDAPPFPLRPGMALTAWLDLARPREAGFVVPRRAILRHDGQAWVYVVADGGVFLRKPVILLAPLDESEAWFVRREGAALSEHDALVVVGAASLLSEEMKHLSGANDEE